MNKKDLRMIAEKSLLNKETLTNQKLEELSIEEIGQIIHELDVHRMELEMQNQELQRAQEELADAKTRYFDLYELAPEGYLVISEKGLIVESNLTATSMLGQSRGELIKQRLSKYIHKSDENIYFAHRETLFETQSHQECVLRMTRKDHTIFWARMKANIVIFEGRPMCSVILSDISERIELELELKKTVSDLLEAQKIAQLGTWHLDLGTNQVVWSAELYKMFGFDSTISPPLYPDQMKLFGPESWNILTRAVNRTRVTGLPYELKLEIVRSDGSKGWAWVRCEAEKNPEGNISSLRGVVQDITEQQKVENELIYLSYHDHLTELYNRRFFEKEIIRLDTKEYRPLSVIMYDVNGLKLVNDSFGHEAGDELLKKTAFVIKKGCREGDFVARIGGDEFVAVLPNTILEEALKIANHIKELASNEMVSNIELSISYGYDTKTTDEQSILDIIGNAENHMYQHKLYERASLRSNTIDLIMNTLFEKSNREAMHSNRVSAICQLIAIKMKLDNNAVNKMKVAGLIHDIGKIGVQEAILNKAGRLTLNERIDIQRHPEVGWRLLSATNEFSKLAEFVLAHHEKWDGSGYPKGLKGEEIPLEARIICIADAYDAMTSDKSYKNRVSQEEAIQEMIRCAGTHFDPKIVEVFVEQVLTSEME